MDECHEMKWRRIEGSCPPCIKNHTATRVDGRLFVFGGYDGRRNHATVHTFDCDTYTWSACEHIRGTPPEGRNGHTATLAERKLFIIGGWLGSGPLAAKDTHYLDVDRMAWVQPPSVGEPPGPTVTLSCVDVQQLTTSLTSAARQPFLTHGTDCNLT